MSIIVSDTSPINNLAAIGELDLLRKIYDRILIAPMVYQEILAAGVTDPGTLAVNSLHWIEVQSPSPSILLTELQQHLDAGEAEAIVLALQIQADRLIMDERRGRQIAIQTGLKVTGLLGILIIAKQRGLIPNVKSYLDQLIEHDFWIRPALYREVLKTVNEITSI